MNESKTKCDRVVIRTPYGGLISTQFWGREGDTISTQFVPRAGDVINTGWGHFKFDGTEWRALVDARFVLELP